MFSMKAIFARTLVALSLAVAAVPAALAGPIYQVAIDTTGQADARFLDLQFGALGSAEDAFATITNLSGDFGAVELSNAFGDIATGFTIGNNSGFNAILFELVQGGMIRFDVRFSTASTGDGTKFEVSLLDQDYGFLGANGPLVTIALMPGVADALSTDSSLVSVTAVPEPADWLLMATGLLMIGTIRRVQMRR